LYAAQIINHFNRPDFVNPFGRPGGGGGSINSSRAGTTTGLALVTNTPDQASSNPVRGSGGVGLKLIF